MKSDWHDLIQRYMDGMTTDDESKLLQETLKSDAKLADLYFSYMNLDVSLQANAGAAELAGNSWPVIPMSAKSESTWFQWSPLRSAAAGIVIGLFSASVVYGYIARSHFSVQTLLVESFEDAELLPGRGVPERADVWSGDLLAPIEARGDVKPFDGKRMVALPPVGRKAVRYAYHFMDLTDLSPLIAGQSRQIEVTAHFHGEQPGAINRLQMRLAVFADDVVEARKIWMNDEVNDLALLHVAKPVRTADAGWTAVRSAIDVPAEARVLLVLLGAGEPAASPSRNEHYLDYVQIRLITQEAFLP